MKTIRNGLTALVFLILFSCEKLVDFSPYDANTSHRDVNSLNVDKITSKQWVGDSIVFIAISDPHTLYADLRDAVGAIKKLEGISFVMVCGDVTDWGLSKEFDTFYHLANRLNIPFITIIGNHDYLSNGKTIYRKMFGPTNFYFDVGSYRVVVFDNIVWENENREPNFNWLRDAMNVPEGTKIITCYHIAPWDMPPDTGYDQTMRQIIEEHPVTLSLFGHGHHYREKTVNERRYIMLPNVPKRKLGRIALKGETAHVKFIHF